MRLKIFSVALLCVAAVALQGPDVAAQEGKFVLGGYMDWDFTAYEANTNPATFDAFHFNPIFLYQIEDNMLASAELEFEHGGDEINLEYAQIDYIANDYVTFTGGKFLVPFGVFNRRLHPTWVSRVPGKPYSNNHVVPTGWSETGVMLSGAVGFGNNGGRVNYAAYVVNGLEGEPGDDIRELRKEKDPRETFNSNKGIGGRLGVVPAPGVEIGVSGYTSKYDPSPDPFLNINMFGADAEYHYQDLFELRGEFNQADQEVGTLANSSQAGVAASNLSYLTKRGYYIQAALRLAATDQDLLMPVELALRYSAQDFPGEANDVYEVTPTVNYYFSSTTVLRLAYTFNGESDGYKRANNQFTALFAKGL